MELAGRRRYPRRCLSRRLHRALTADRQATEKKRPQVEKNILPPAVRLKNEKRPFPLRTKNCQHNPNNRLTGKAPYTRKPQRPTARQEESTFLAKFTIVPIPIWLELEKDRPVRPHSGYSPSAATGSFATGTDGSNRSPSASESVVNERQIEFGEMRPVSSTACRCRMLAEQVIPDLVRPAAGTLKYRESCEACASVAGA